MSYGNPPPPPPPPGYGAVPPAYGGGAPAKTNQKAIWSLVTGILGVLCCIVFAVVALVLSFQAKEEIKNRGEGGQGLATAGLVLGVIGLVVGVIQIALFASGNSMYGDFG